MPAQIVSKQQGKLDLNILSNLLNLFQALPGDYFVKKKDHGAITHKLFCLLYNSK